VEIKSGDLFIDDIKCSTVDLITTNNYNVGYCRTVIFPNGESYTNPIEDYSKYTPENYLGNISENLGEFVRQVLK